MDLDGKKYFEKNEKGEIMLEGMIVIIITLFILIWILAVGFIYYQRYITVQQLALLMRVHILVHHLYS